MEIIENEQKYLQERGFPNDRLTMAHKQIQEEKRKSSTDALRTIYNESERYLTKFSAWEEYRDKMKAQGLPMTHILKMQRQFQENIEEDFIAFKEERTKR